MKIRFFFKFYYALILCGFVFLLPLPCLAEAATGKYIIVHAWNPGPDNPYYFKNCSTEWVKPMLDALGKKGDDNLQLGFSDVIYALNTDDATIRECLDKFFFASEHYNVPFLLHLDVERFWDSRPDLWNWFDPAKSGYSLANKDNVEWSGWNTATKESFINWGSPIKLAPKPCYESVAVKRVIASKLEIIASKLNTWRQKLSNTGKEYLFAGVDVAWETGIDDYRNASWLASEYKYQLGYNALSKRGFSVANPPVNIDVELKKIVKDFNEYRAKFFYDRGISKDKIYTHVWAAEDQNNAGSAGYVQHSPISTGINDYSTLGVSLYPSAYDINRVKAAIGSVPWALIESPSSVILTAPANSFSIKDWLNYGNCKLAVVYGLSVSQPETLSQIKQVVSFISANNDPIGYFDGADCNNATGWVCDSNNYSQSLKVDLYADGVAGRGVLIGTTVADVVREGAVANLCGGNAHHGFVFSIPKSLKDGKTHTIYAYGINVPSGNNPILSRSTGVTTPVTIKCDVTQICVPNSVNGCRVCKADGSEWSDDHSKCPVNQTCSDGQCVANCTANASKKCDSGKLYWFNSCNTKETLFQDCGSDKVTLNYRCNGGWIQRETIKKGCADNACTNDSIWFNDVDCKASGKVCVNGVCVTGNCIPKTCNSLNCECGSVSDGCGNDLVCGTCDSGDICVGGICVDDSSATKQITKMTRVEIIAKINEIAALITKLQEELKSMTGSFMENDAAGYQGNIYSCNKITKYLYYGMRNDSQVRCLQEILKAQGFYVVPTGDYDGATRSAVEQFQIKYTSDILAPYGLDHGSGNVGDLTKNRLNQFIGEE